MPDSPIVWVQRSYYSCKEQMHGYDGGLPMVIMATDKSMRNKKIN